MDEPLTASVKVGEREITMRSPTKTQILSLLDFERQAALLDKLPDGDDKDKRSVTLARRSLILIEKITMDPADWDWIMDSMMAEEIDWSEFNDIPYRLFEALERQGNRATRRAKATRVRKE